jgi:hypothetical protein
MAAAGHQNFATTQVYIREAEPIKEGFGTVFPPLDSEAPITPQSEIRKKTSAEGGT